MFFRSPMNVSQHAANIASKPHRKAEAQKRLLDQEIKHAKKSNFDLYGISPLNENVEAKQIFTHIDKPAVVFSNVEPK